jgi:signal transduction histidine kinase
MSAPGAAPAARQRTPSRPLPAAGAGGEGEASSERSVADFFGDALDGAMTLVHADGGDIATLDADRQVLVLRARRTQPRLDAPSPLAGASRGSQPSFPSITATASGPAGSIAHMGRMPLASPTGISGLADETDLADEIDEQSTQLLPAALTTRVYHKGEHLIGLCWQRGEPVVMTQEECRKLPGGSTLAEHEAPWHLAVPIFRPTSLASLRTGKEIIGVISVYIRDPLWSFTARDVELLQLHADRVAYAMRSEELARQNQSQTELLNLLDLEEEHRTGSHAIFTRLLGVVRRMIEAPAFAILLYHRESNQVIFELAERDEEPINLVRLPTSRMPAWWGPVARGQTVCVSAPEDRALHPEYCHLGWEEDPPVLSILAAPLIFQNTFLGAIVAGSPRSDVYAPEHAQLFTAISRSAAVVVQNALLADKSQHFIEKTHKKEQQLAVLNNAVLTLNASLDPEATVQAIASQAAALTDALMCVVLLKDETGKYLVGRAANRRPPDPFTARGHLRIPLDWRHMANVLNDGQFVLLDNLDADWSDDSDIGQTLAEQQILSCLVLPLIHKEKQLGVLAAYTPGMRHHFTSEEIGLLQGVASQGAVAIYNALLYRELQEAYDKQKELDRLKDEFILTVSHEFRTPVTAIEGYVTLISRHGHKLEQAKLDQFAHEIHQATNQLMGMINMLHDANSLSDKPLELTPYPVNVRAAAEKAINVQPPEATARLALEMDRDYWVLADGERLVHVFSNLLSNAIKYSPGEAPCQITTRIETRERLAQQGRPHAQAQNAPERWVVIGVRDQGEGIAPEDQPKLFQKFVRLPRSLTTSVRGTGLGLWICKQYLNAMGGDIWVESEYGDGAYFQFSLPLAEPPNNG